MRVSARLLWLCVAGAGCAPRGAADGGAASIGRSGSGTGAIAVATTGAGSGASSGGSGGSGGGCLSTAECADPRSSCQGGQCLPNGCAADAGLYSLCNAAGIADGTCVPDVTLRGFAQCQQGGASSQDCSATATRATASLLCAAGELCTSAALGDAGSVCRRVCDAARDAGCGPGQVCLFDGLVGSAGFCFAQGAGGCVESLPGGFELAACDSDLGCGCPQRCAYDRGLDASLCELPCSATAADCPTASTQCQAGLCAPNYCGLDPLGQPAGDAGLGQPCDAAGRGDGLCAPVFTLDAEGDLLQAFGLCTQVGDAPLASACDRQAPRSAPALRCGQGALCVEGASDGGTICAAVCAPLADSGCQNRLGCFTQLPPPFVQAVGVCLACTPPGQQCLNASECCSASCNIATGLCL